MPLLTIDDREIEVPDGTTILQAARALAIDIPVFCHHDSLSTVASCRMCLVEVEGTASPVQSCAAKAEAGMVVRTTSPLALEARGSVLASLLADHPRDCPVCDSAGECALQTNYFRHGAGSARSRPSEHHCKAPTVIGENVLLHQERCINCSRCIRFCQEVSKSNQLVQALAGQRSVAGLSPGRSFTDPYSLCTVDLCPSGALSSRDFRFRQPAWVLEQTPSICPECSRGCALTVCHAGNTIYRLQPRYAPLVNGWWACDAGRLAYPKYGSDRVTRGYVGLRTDEELLLPPMAAALAGGRWLQTEISAGGQVALVLDGCLSLEEAFAVFSFARQFVGTDEAFLGLLPDGTGDSLLRNPQPAANARGLAHLARRCGIELLPAAGLFAEHRQWGAVVCFGAEVELPRPDQPDQAGRVLLFAWRHNQVTRIAHTLVPLAAHFEKGGSYVNFAGVVQPATAALQPPPGIVSLPLMLRQMALQSGVLLDYTGAKDLSEKALAEFVIREDIP